jgi:hypothetical protein
MPPKGVRLKALAHPAYLGLYDRPSTVEMWTSTALWPTTAPPGTGSVSSPDG